MILIAYVYMTLSTLKDAEGPFSENPCGVNMLRKNNESVVFI